MKHSPETNLEDLDFEAIDKEINADEVAQAGQAAAGEDPLASKKGNDTPPT